MWFTSLLTGIVAPAAHGATGASPGRGKFWSIQNSTLRKTEAPKASPSDQSLVIYFAGISFQRIKHWMQDQLPSKWKLSHGGGSGTMAQSRRVLGEIQANLIVQEM